MLMEAPHILTTLEQSAFGAAIRQSTWAYPAANVGHIVSLTLLAGSVAIMDARLLGAFAATSPASIVRPARRMAIGALGLMAMSGFVLFTAEASHVALNPVFQTKMALIILGVLNAGLVGGALSKALEVIGPHQPLPGRVRLAAGLSMLIWISVAACGRLIAYF